MHGIFVTYKGYVEASSKFFKLYDANKSTSYLMYLDANVLWLCILMNSMICIMIILYQTKILY